MGKNISSRILSEYVSTTVSWNECLKPFKFADLFLSYGAMTAAAVSRPGSN